MKWLQQAEMNYVRRRGRRCRRELFLTAACHRIDNVSIINECKPGIRSAMLEASTAIAEAKRIFAAAENREIKIITSPQGIAAALQ